MEKVTKVSAEYLFKDDSFRDESIDACDLILCGSMIAVDFTEEFGFDCIEVWPSVKIREGTFS